MPEREWDNPKCTIIYLVNGERHRDACSLESFLGPRLRELRDAGFTAWIERNEPRRSDR